MDSQEVLPCLSPIQLVACDENKGREVTGGCFVGSTQHEVVLGGPSGRAWLGAAQAAL